MPEELVFVVEESQAQAAERISLSEAGLKERRHLQEWVLDHPEILGSEIRIVSTEFDKWITSTGEPDRDRLDILGLDKGGRLVVGELKRGVAPESTLGQGLRYSALTSRFTLEQLAEHHARYLERKTHEPRSEEEALEALEDWAEELSDETLAPPRLVLVASDFPVTLTATAMFLSDIGLDITLRRFQPYRTPLKEVLITVSQVFPPEDFPIGPGAGRGRATRERKREANAVTRIIQASAISDGAKLQFTPIPQVAPDVQDQIKAWVSEEPKRGIAYWDSKGGKRPLKWALDDKLYSPTALTLHLMKEAADLDYPSIRGTAYWTTEDGKSLVEIADSAGP
jgi:hypothetical protein